MALKDVLIATANRGKAREITEIFQNSGFLPHFLYEYPKLANLNIQENANSFEGNALIKAIIIGQSSGILTLADDSGLCVDVLAGAPGIRSARYSEAQTDAANNNKLLSALAGVPMEKRDCHYHCSVAIYDPADNFVETTVGLWPGRVATELRGEKSFGYAPLFLSVDFNYEKTNAECDPEELIAINHRGRAFRAALVKLKEKYLS